MARPAARSRLAAWAHEHTPAIISLLCLALLYVGALVAMPPDGLTEHDTGAKYLQVRNLRLAPFGLDWSINYPARPLDPQLQFVPFADKQHYVDGAGRIYLQWPIFLGLLTRIPWKVMGFWGLYVVPLLAGLGTTWAAYLLALALGVPRRVAWLAVPLVGLATPVAIYSLLYFEHTLAALLVTVSLLALCNAERAMRNKLEQSAFRTPRSAIASGVALALAIYFRSELYVLALVVVAALGWIAWRQPARRLVIAWVAAFGLALVPLWLFYGISEGTILPLHATWYFAAGDTSGASAAASGIGLPRLRYITSAGLGVVPDFLFGPQQFPLSPLYPWWAAAAGLVGFALCALAATGRLVRRIATSPWRLYLLIAGLVLLLVPELVTLFSTQPYYNLHGFLLASPFVALALWPAATNGNNVEDHAPERSGGSKLIYAITLLYVALHALVISALSGLGPISMHEWGQRYLLPAYPALTALALLVGWRLWSDYAPKARRTAMLCIAMGGILVLAGAGFTVRGYAMLSDERSQVAGWLQLARTLPDREPLVTDVWWLPLNLAADFYTRPVMLAQGDSRLAQWAAEMRSHGVTSFGLMTNSPATLTGQWLANTPGLQAEEPPRQVRGMWLQQYLFH